uniref:Uncharacterized protein n=1 Tax=Kalanchoe fedtschenkoi TaxID=63787 RepID=A0A7N0VGZ6_KALFE
MSNWRNSHQPSCQAENEVINWRLNQAEPKTRIRLLQFFRVVLPSLTRSRIQILFCGLNVKLADICSSRGLPFSYSLIYLQT